MCCSRMCRCKLELAQYTKVEVLHLFGIKNAEALLAGYWSDASIPTAPNANREI